MFISSLVADALWLKVDDRVSVSLSSLYVQLVFLSGGTDFFQTLCCQKVHNHSNTSRPCWTYRHALHAGYTLGRVNRFRVREWNGICWALLGTNATTIASTSAFGVGHFAAFLIRSIAWHLRHCAVITFCLIHDVSSKLP